MRQHIPVFIIYIFFLCMTFPSYASSTAYPSFLPSHSIPALPPNALLTYPLCTCLFFLSLPVLHYSNTPCIFPCPHHPCFVTYPTTPDPRQPHSPVSSTLPHLLSPLPPPTSSVSSSTSTPAPPLRPLPFPLPQRASLGMAARVSGEN